MDEGLAVGASLGEVILCEVDKRADVLLTGDVLRGSTAVGAVGVGRDVSHLDQVSDEAGVLDAQQNELVVEDQHTDEGVEIVLGEAARQRGRSRLVAAVALLRNRRTLVGVGVVERPDQAADLGEVTGTERTRDVRQDALGVVADGAQNELSDPDTVSKIDVVGDERLAQRDGGGGDLRRDAELHGRLVGRPLLLLDRAEELAGELEHEVRALVVPVLHRAVGHEDLGVAVVLDQSVDAERDGGASNNANDNQDDDLRTVKTVHRYTQPFRELTPDALSRELCNHLHKSEGINPCFVHVLVSLTFVICLFQGASELHLNSGFNETV